MNHQEHADSQMSDAEVLTTAIVAMLCCGGNYAQACRWLARPYFIPKMLSRSRFSRQLHRLQPYLLSLSRLLGELSKDNNEDQNYALDTFPVAVCDNYRIKRCRLHWQEAYRGYIASKKRYFYSLKVHILVTKRGEPVNFFGSTEIQGVDKKKRARPSKSSHKRWNKVETFLIP